MTQLKSLAHPGWPYAGTAHEWRGFVKSDKPIIPAGYEVKFPERVAEEMKRPDGIIEITRIVNAWPHPIYQKQNFGPELK